MEVDSRVAVSWPTFVEAEPVMSALVRSRLDAAEHHVLATLRSDGTPRVNGTNVVFHEGDLLIGCMPRTRRADDLRRDPRCALHTAPDLPTLPEGDARLDCIANQLSVERTKLVFQRLAADSGVHQDGEPLDGDLFELRIRSASVVQVDAEQLTVTAWTPGRGLRVLPTG